MASADLAKVPLGRTGLSVSPIGFGASSIGDMPDTYGYEVGLERAHACLLYTSDAADD